MKTIRFIGLCLISVLLLGIGSAAAEDNGAFPTEISDPATYVPDTAETAEPDVEPTRPTEISDAVTIVPETPEATAPAEDNDDNPTEISDAATYVPETPESADSGSAASGSGSGPTNQPQPLAVQQLPNAGSGSSTQSEMPWLLVLAIAGFAGTMAVRIRRASRNS